MNDRLDKIAPGLPAKLELLLDALLVCCGLVLALPADAPWHLLVPTALVSWFLGAAVLRLYSPCTPRKEPDNLALGALGAVGITVPVAAVGMAVGFSFELQALVELTVMVFGATTLSRLLLSKPSFWRTRQPRDRILVVGTGALGVATYERLTSLAQRPATVVGFLRLPNEPETPACDARVLGDHSDLAKVLSNHSIDEVYIAGRVVAHGQVMQDLVRVCEEVGTPFALPLHTMAFERATLLTSAPAPDGYLHYLNMPRSPMHYALKRLVDILLAGTALVMLSPLLIGVAVAIKLTSRGPVLFRQVRVGLHGVAFNFLKFRSMVVDAEERRAELMKSLGDGSTVAKMKHDPRITRVGRFIRKYSIDELPQLVNVLRGDMSIVGPRPALPDEVTTYKSWQRRRLSVRPGLTCYWQVHDRSEMSFEDWMRLDLRYVDDWSLAIDFMLIAQTIPVVLGGRTVSNELYVWRGND